eukprot:4764161-Amphidinium_carterae.1
MEDAHIAMPDFDVDRGIGLFGVFDGHGGSAVARVVASHLPTMLRQLSSYREAKYEVALKELFIELDQYLLSGPGRAALAAVDGGGSKKVAADEEDAFPDILRNMMMQEEDSDSDEELSLESMALDESKPRPLVVHSQINNPENIGTTAVVALIVRRPALELF